jgi:nitrite transporter NirC
MSQSALDTFADLSVVKARTMRDNPLGFFIGAMMAGAYVGIGIILIFSLGQLAEPAARPLIMGVSFGIALSLVVFAGAELFTGYTMIMTIGLLKGKVGPGALTTSWIATWVGNLAGSVLIGYLFYLGGGGQILKEGADLIFNVASMKMSGDPLSLLARGILCNWLVCLALWTSTRAKDDAAKLLLIFWCLFAFIASGFEHSVANMTVFAIALLGNHPETVTLAGAAHNRLGVTLGNTIAGAVFMGAGYILANKAPAAPKPVLSDAVAAE